MDQPITIDGPPDPLDKDQWRRSRTSSVAVDTPFDPRPLMAERAGRVTTDRFRFAVFGDTHHGAAFDRIIEEIRRQNVDFALACGDLVDLGGGREGAVNYIRLAAQAGAFFRSMPVWPVMGNHDVDSRWTNDVWNGFANFTAFFGVKPYYAFTFRNATFLVLSWMLPDEAEMAWLADQLATRGTEHLFVAAHYPLLRPGEVDGSPLALELRRLFAAHGVACHFSGHAHIYHRTRRDGVTYLISGGAGCDIHRIPNPADLVADAYYGRDPADERYLLHTDRVDRVERTPSFFYVIIDVSGSRIAGRVISTAGETWDQFAL